MYAGTTGKITGVVVDQVTGEPLPSVNIMIAGTTQGTASDLDGHYIILNVSPGTHTIVFKSIGFADYKVTGVVVTIDKTTKIDAELSFESIEISEIVVQAEKPPIEKDRTYSSTVVNSKSIQALPVTEVSELLTLQSGVVKDGDGDLHFRGGRSREIAYVIDGVPVTNSFDDNGGTNVSVENSMIEQLEVITGTFNAEYGSAQSGVVNIVTKGITRKLAMNVSAFTGDWLSNKNDIYLGVEQFSPLTEKDIQASISTPIISDKLGISLVGRYNSSESLEWYEKRYNTLDGWKIAAYQRWFREQRSDVLGATQAIKIPDSLKTGDGSMGNLSSNEKFSGNFKINYLPFTSLKIAYQAFGTLSYDIGGGSSKRYQPDGAGQSQSLSHSHFLTIRHTPTDNFFYNIAASYQYNRGESWFDKSNKIARYPGDSGIQPIGFSSDGFSLGNTDGFYTNADGKNFRKLFILNGDFNWQIDKYNFIKAGFEYKHHEVNTYSWGYISTPDWANKKWLNFAPDPELTFNKYWNIMTNYWKNWEEINDTVRFRRYREDEITLWRDYTITPSEAAVYLQDKIELGEIIVNAGLRLDVFMPNEQVPINYRVESSQLSSAVNLKNAKNKFNLSPRIGISFPISATGAFHAAYGHFFQMPSFRRMFNEPIHILTPLQLDGKRLGNADLKPERTIQYELGLQQQLVPGITADVSIYYKDMNNLLGIEALTTIDNVRFERYINRDYGNSKGIAVGINAYGSDFVKGSVNYTFATANGSASDPEFIALVQASTQIGGDPIEFLNRQIISLDWDQTHTVNAFVDFQFTERWDMSVIGTYWTGQPYSPEFIEKFDILRQEYNNADTKPVQWSVDFKTRYVFNIGNSTFMVFLQADNLFDHLNQNDVFNSTGNAYNNARLPVNEKLEVERLKQAGLFTLDEIDNNPGWFSSPRRVRLGLTFNF